MAPARAAAAAASAGPTPSQIAWRQSQLADTVRRPWVWVPRGGDSGVHLPQAKGKWWSKEEEEIKGWGAERRRAVSHAGLMLETDLGEQLLGDRRCDRCQAESWECWVYSSEGAKQISKAGDSCARCRCDPRKGGCNLSKRKKPVRRGPRGDSPPTSLRALLPKGPPPPPPGAGGITA